MLHKTFVGNMDYSFHLCQNMFSDDKEMNKDMMAEWTQWKWNTKGELSISQRKDKGSDKMEIGESGNCLSMVNSQNWSKRF